MKVFKSIITFLMLAVMLIIGSRYFVFRSMVKMQKKEFRQLILKQEHKTIKRVYVSADDLYKDVKGLEWKENNKEVVINDVYHEVLSVKKTDDIYVVSIIEDKEENDLFKRFFDKAGNKKDLPGYILLVFGMNFISSPVITFDQGAALPITHQTHNALNSGSDVYSRPEKPPRA